ncbi:MAG: response regulator, partial [Thiobacillus sp.]|nr:response regulator [Thiobacillus sp.]
MNLLLLDDHPLVRQGLATLLAQAGAAVRTASSPDEALAVLDAGACFDVVLLDWNLPGSDGAATVAALSARGQTVLVVSGSAEADDVRRVLAAG